MKKRLIIVALVTLLLSITALYANSTPVTVDGTGMFPGSFGILNPCTNEVISGPIQIHLVVTTNQAPNGNLMVNVHHTSQGLLTGASGHQYQISRHAKAQFSAVAAPGPEGGYIIPWKGEFVGKGTAPNFEANGTLRVIVNAQNEPVGSSLQPGTIRTCTQ